MQKWWHVSWKRIAIVLAVLFALVWAAGKSMKWLAPWIEARSMLRDNPTLVQLPIPLPDQTLAKLSDSTIVLFGLTVYTPWGRFGTIQSAPGMATIPFPERHIEMLLYEPNQDTFEKKMWNSVPTNSTNTAISSYKLMAAEMAITPNHVKWWRSPDQNEASSFLLELKSLKLGGMRALYSVNTGHFRGFQEGNPALPPYRVRLDLFDLADYHYEILMSAQSGNGPAFSQADVNAIVASLKPLPRN